MVGGRGGQSPLALLTYLSLIHIYVGSARRAEILGVALRLAYTLSAGTPDLLAGTSLQQRDRRLILHLAEGSGVFAGEAVVRRLDRLAQALGLEAATEV